MALQLAEPANTQAVRLTWSPSPRAAGYRIYRNIFEPGTAPRLGAAVGRDRTAPIR